MSRTLLTTLLALLLTSVALQAQTTAEEVRIKEVFRKTPLSKVFKVFQEKYHVPIAYDNTLIQNIVVALHLNDLNLTQSLERLLENTPLTFQHVGANIIIIPKPPELIEVTDEQKNILISGTIVDADTRETLPQATLHVPGTGISATSNNDGKFTILSIPNDTCSIVIRYLGYVTQTIRVKDIKTSTNVIQLKSDTKILNEVVVLDEYNQALHIDDTPGASTFNIKSLSSLPSLGEQDISRTLQLIPGVTATDESSSGMIIRGSHSSYNLTLLDGITVYQQDHFFGSFSIINADIVKDVQVHKGMFDAKYGGRISGVVDMTSRNGNTTKPAFTIKLNSIDTKGTVEIPLGKKWSLFAGARRSLTDVYQSNLFNSLFDLAEASNDQIGIFNYFEGIGREEDPRFYFFDTNSKLSFRPSDRDIFSLSSYVSRDKLNLTSDVSIIDDTYSLLFNSEERTRWGNNGLSLRWGRQWSNQYYSNLRMSGSRFFRNYDYQQYAVENDIPSSYDFGFENSISDLTYALDNEWILRDNLFFNWGLLGTYQQSNLHMYDKFVSDDFPDESDTDIIRDDFSLQHSLYGSLVTSPINHLTLTAGSRFVYYYNQADQFYFEPRLTATYQVTEHLNLKTAYGRNNQFVSQSIYYSPIGSLSGISENYWMLSRPEDDDYPVMSSDHISTGATLRRTQVVFDAEIFYKAGRGISIDENINSGTTDSYGLDFMIQKTSGIHKGWIAYTLSQALQKHPDILDGETAPTWQDQRHELKIVDMLMLGNWNLSSTLVFGSGKPYPKYIVTYERDDMDVIVGYDVDLDYSNQSRLPAYFRMDLAVSYTKHFKKSRELQAGLSIHNVTNHKNIKTRKLDTENLTEAILTNTPLPAAYTDLVLLGFTPTLFLSFSF